MQGRVRELRLHFGLDQRTLAGYLGVPVEQVEQWEAGTKAVTEQVAALFEARFGVSSRWLLGDDVLIWSERLEQVRQKLAGHINSLSGPRLVEMISATTGERIAYAVNWIRRAEPELCTLECMAGWLGLSPGSTQLLLRGELDPGSPVVLRASDLTGISGRWFRMGPVDQL
jgi:transcriptional regulator with XRE-family HTH domain